MCWRWEFGSQKMDSPFPGCARCPSLPGRTPHARGCQGLGLGSLPLGSWGPTLRTGVAVTPASCLLSPSSGRSPSSNIAARRCPAPGWEAPPRGISSFQEAFDLSPPSLWVIFCPEIPLQEAPWHILPPLHRHPQLLILCSPSPLPLPKHPAKVSFPGPLCLSGAVKCEQERQLKADRVSHTLFLS